jgi:hypothetical protein
MFKFSFKDIRIEATVNIQQQVFTMGSKGHVTRETTVSVRFWNFVITDNLYELAMIKSTMNYFMQAYWKRSTKQGTKIEMLATSIEHNYGAQKLNFTPRQKNSIHSLEVSLIDGGLPSTSMYLSAQDVIMLDIAISKAIALLTPEAKLIND